MSSSATDIKAIILSAGQGQRLKPLTNDRPKGMVAINGRTIIERQIELFHRVGIKHVSIVKGFCAESVPDYGARHYLNPEYATTNMVYSLFAAAEELAGGTVVVSYGDIVYSEEVLRTLLGVDAPVAVAVDREWKAYFAQRFEDPFDDAESLIMDAAGGIRSIGQSRPAPTDVQAQYIGLIKFQEAGLTLIRQLYETYSKTETALGWGRPWRKAFMTDLLQELVNRGERVIAAPISGGWCEVDSAKDFEIAGRIVAGFLA